MFYSLNQGYGYMFSLQRLELCLCHPCPGCDWHLHSVGRKEDLCPGYASINPGCATYSSWICQNEFSYFGIKNVPEILVWKEARLRGRNRRGFAKVHAACRDLRAELYAMTQVYLLCLVYKVSHKKKMLPLGAEKFLLSDFCIFH